MSPQGAGCPPQPLPGRQGWHRRVPGTAQGLLLTTHPVLLPKAVAVANDLACRGLDHLEERIPALQYPVDKVSPVTAWDPSASLQSPQHLLWPCSWVVINCSGGNKATPSSEGSFRGVLQPRAGLAHSQTWVSHP